MIRAGLAAALLLLATGCATVKTGGREGPPPEPGRASIPPGSPTVGGLQTGIASWYGERHHGRRTASGEPYDMNTLTAAHRTLPFGTVVEVTSLATGASVEVRINDRGPHVGGRIIDLSLAAARQIGLVGAGIGPVRLRVVSRSDDKDGTASAAALPVTPATGTTDPPDAQPVSVAPAAPSAPGTPR